MTELPEEVTATQLGRLLGRSRKRVEQLATDGTIARTDKGRYPLVASVSGFIAWLTDEARRSSKTAAQSRLQDARAEQIELRIAKEKRTLIPIEDGEAVMEATLAPFLADLDSLPARVTDDLPLRRKIEDEIGLIRGRAHERAERAQLACRDGRDPLDEGWKI